jgi:hypothetical protein
MVKTTNQLISTYIRYIHHIYATEVFGVGNFCTPGDKINGKYVQKIVARVLGILRSRVQKGWALGPMAFTQVSNDQSLIPQT